MGRTSRAAAATAAAALLAGLQLAAGVVSRGQAIEGYATFYGGPQDGVSPTTPTGGLLDGACGYTELSPNEWPNWNVVSIGPNNPIAYKGNKKGCGYCVQATCTGPNCGAGAKPVTLLVTDECVSCAPNQLNVNALSFQNAFNADLSVGRVNITFEQVDCTPPGNMLAKVVKSRASEGGYIGFALLAVAGEGTITSVEIKGQGAEWQRMANIYGDVWEASMFGAAPLSIRTTDDFGLTLTAPNVITQIAEGTYNTGVQYPLSGQAAGVPVAGAPARAPSAATRRAPAPAPTRAVAAGFGPGFLAAPAGTFCDARCFGQGLTASQFKKIGTQLSTFACGASDGSGAALSGYQFSNGTATCSVASPGGPARDATDYSCLCQTQAQTQGLQPYNGTACSAACNIAIDGLTGAAVAADAAGSSYVCLPLSETSRLNRFGHTVTTGSGTACAYNQDGQSQAADAFSCFCLFTAPAAKASA